MHRLTSYKTAVLVLLSIPMWAQTYRSIDGSGNNLVYPAAGSTNDKIINYVPLDYADKVYEPKLDETYNRPNPRVVSNALFDQPGLIFDKTGLSDFAWVFGQFIDHDLSLVEEDQSKPLKNIVIPRSDLHFEPGSVMPIFRSKISNGTGTSESNPVRFENKITAFLDGSMIYGSDEIRASWLRAGVDGKLKTSEGNLLPWNTTDGNFNGAVDYSAPQMGDETKSLVKFFVAGDVRANENPLLIAMHTLFLREHNRLCEDLKNSNPGWNDEKLYQEARKLNIAFLQNIVFNEWLPALGIHLPNYSGYVQDINPQIMNVFSAAAFRIGHTLINSNILRLDNEGRSMTTGSMRLRDAFFNPQAVLLTGGIEPFFQGMGTQTQQELDCRVVDDVRNFLFASNGKKGLDLVAINITRGRERGLPSFNGVANAFGLPSYKTFSALTDAPQEAAALQAVYGNVDNLDPWVGMLAEKHMPNAIMGRLMMTILEKQFQDLRDGDRYYFENDASISEAEYNSIKNTHMRDILMRNTAIELMQNEVFKAMPFNNIPFGPKPLPIELRAELYPNPVSAEGNMNIYSEKEQNVKALVYDVSGRIVYEHNLHLYKGITKKTIDFSRLSGGMYNIVLSNDKAYTILRMYKK